MISIRYNFIHPKRFACNGYGIKDGYYEEVDDINRYWCGYYVDDLEEGLWYQVIDGFIVGKFDYSKGEVNSYVIIIDNEYLSYCYTASDGYSNDLHIEEIL